MNQADIFWARLNWLVRKGPLGWLVWVGLVHLFKRFLVLVHVREIYKER